MNFDLDTNNYTKDDYMDIFNLDKSMNPSKETVEKNYNNLLNNIEEENLDQDEKQKMKQFLIQCKNNLFTFLKEDKNKYELIESDFTTELAHSETFQSNNKFVIKRNKNADEYHTNKINPIAKQTTTQLVNINTKFRKSYYNTVATDFVIDLTEEFKNVISLTVQSVQIPNSNYTFCSKLGTNEFTIELYDYSDNPLSIIPGTKEKKTIKITDGIYSGNMLADYLNTYVFSDLSLNRIACKYDSITRKFGFFRDYRILTDGGQPTGTDTHAFNIDWRLSDDQSRPIQLNMGWILGYRQQYYDWDTDYTD